MKEFNEVLAWSKSTKRTEVFINADEEALVSTLYISKRAFPEQVPETIMIAVVGADEKSTNLGVYVPFG
jgi:hypothetical protein